MTRLCAFLICSLAFFGLSQSHSLAQARLDVARPNFGSAPPQPVSALPAGVAQQLNAAPTGEWGPAMVPGLAGDRDTPLGVGDIVTFSIQEDRDLPIRLRVTDSGELDIPYVGRIPAVGRTSDRVASEAKRQLEARYYYKATVKLGIDQRAVGRSLGKVYVTGLVRTPGSQDFYPGERLTVSAAIVKAGGFMQFAWKSRVKVTRKDKSGKTESFNVDVGAVFDKGKIEKDVEVQDGDFVNVPQKPVNF